MNENFLKLYKELNFDIKGKILDLLYNEINFPDYITDFLFSKLHLLISEKNRNVNNILPIFHLLKEKVLNKNFLEQLEKDLGIFFDTEQYIKEINFLKTQYLDRCDILNENFYYGINDIIFLQAYRDHINKRKILYDFLFYKDKSYFTNYPFIKIYKVGDYLFKTIPLDIRLLVEKEKNICKKLPIKKRNRNRNRKRKDEIKKNRINRINIKNSYDKNYNKGFL